MRLVKMTGKISTAVLTAVPAHRLVKWGGGLWVTETAYRAHELDDGRRLLRLGGDESDWADAPHTAEVEMIDVFEVDAAQ